MKCAWKELLIILPNSIRPEVEREGRGHLQELRLRMNAPPELVLDSGSIWLQHCIGQEDLQFCINAASRYSPWSAETTADGFLTAPGGHRIGLCGEVVVHNGSVTGIRKISSLCIRVARDFPGIAAEIRPTHSVLILGAPGWGKTTLLRDLAREIGKKETVCVVDERGELFPEGVQRGKRMDVLSGCPKRAGIMRVLRTMGPDWIAVDEVTAQEDCAALLHAMGCGVRLLASCHAGSKEEFLSRNLYCPLVNSGMFSHLLILNQKKQWRMERMNECT